METTAMVLAEMVATGELKKITRPGLGLDLSRPVSMRATVSATVSGSVMSCCTSRAWSSQT